jgi:hypothetical protein
MMRSLYLLFLLLPAIAAAQSVTAPAAQYKNFGGNVAGQSGNGADLTEDILPTCGFAIPVNATPNVGDVFQVTLGGKFIGSTDTKTVRVRFGTTNAGVPIMLTVTGNTATHLFWVAIIKYMKTGFNTQNIAILANVGSNANAFSGTSFSTGSFQETVLNNFTVTGQNATTAVANSVTCQYMQMEYFGASS